MNNKEFIAFLSEKNGTSTRITAELTNALVAEVSAQLEDENTVSIAGFGAFEVKKKLERVLVNPATKQRMLVEQYSKESHTIAHSPKTKQMLQVEQYAKEKHTTVHSPKTKQKF